MSFSASGSFMTDRSLVSAIPDDAPSEPAFRPLRYAACTMLGVLLAALILPGCDLTGTDEDDRTLVTTGVVVGSSGAFGQGTGSVDVYDPEAGQLGSQGGRLQLVHSLALSKDNEAPRLFAVLNTSGAGTVRVFDPTTLVSLWDVSFSPSPRYVALEENNAYVTLTDFSADTQDEVAVVDLETRAEVGRVGVGVGPEGIAATGGRLFVANSNDGTLSIIDAATDENAGTIDLACNNPRHVFVDEEDEVVVTCLGATVYNEDFSEVVSQTDGAFVFVDPDAEAVTGRIDLDRQLGSTNGTQSAYYAASAEALYALSSGTGAVLRVDTDANALTETLSVPPTDGLTGLSAIAYDGTARRLYLGRLATDEKGAASFTLAGGVVVLDESGAVLDRFEAGIAPAHIDFLREEE